jgi:fatty acid desaturase
MFMHVPCYNLPRTHRLLKAKGVLAGMLTAPSYLDVLRQASSRPAIAGVSDRTPARQLPKVDFH